MKYPADEESTVFYNPVQVQNRDLSILMMVLYAERRVIQQALVEKKKELRASNHGKASDDPTRLSGSQIQQLLQDYQASLDPTSLLCDVSQSSQSQQSSSQPPPPPPPSSLLLFFNTTRTLDN